VHLEKKVPFIAVLEIMKFRNYKPKSSQRSAQFVPEEAKGTKSEHTNLF